MQRPDIEDAISDIDVALQHNQKSLVDNAHARLRELEDWIDYLESHKDGEPYVIEAGKFDPGDHEGLMYLRYWDEVDEFEESFAHHTHVVVRNKVREEVKPKRRPVPNLDRIEEKLRARLFTTYTDPEPVSFSVMLDVVLLAKRYRDAYNDLVTGGQATTTHHHMCDAHPEQQAQAYADWRNGQET